MAATSLTERYISLIKSLLPQGWAWRRIKEKGSNGDELISTLAVEFCRTEERGFTLIDEAFCDTTFELLEDWERVLNIPDECSPTDRTPSLSERRARVCQKENTKGGQNADFYKLIAEQLGYDISVLDVVDFKPFKAGQSTAGDALNNDSAENPTGWSYTFAIELPATTVRFFRAGQGSAGDSLRLLENEELQCVINKFKPAHTIVQFIFT